MRTGFAVRCSVRQAGFTLLEIMVVVVLIAISATFAVVSLDRDADHIAELESRRFAQLVKQARDESIMSGRPYAVDVNTAERSYTFLESGEEWAAVEDDDMFRRRRIPEDVRVEFETRAGPDSRGLLVIDGLAAMTPFVLRLEGESRVYEVSLDESQNVVVAEKGDETG